VTAVPVSAPQSFVYDNSKTYTVLDNCVASSSTAQAICPTDGPPCFQTTNEAVRLVKTLSDLCVKLFLYCNVKYIIALKSRT